MVIRPVWLRRAWMSIAASPSLPRTTGSPTVLPSWVIVAPGEVGWAEMGVAIVDLLNNWDARPSRLRGGRSRVPHQIARFPRLRQDGLAAQAQGSLRAVRSVGRGRGSGPAPQ